MTPKQFYDTIYEACQTELPLNFSVSEGVVEYIGRVGEYDAQWGWTQRRSDHYPYRNFVSLSIDGERVVAYVNRVDARRHHRWSKKPSDAFTTKMMLAVTKMRLYA